MNQIRSDLNLVDSTNIVIKCHLNTNGTDSTSTNHRIDQRSKDFVDLQSKNSLSRKKSMFSIYLVDPTRDKYFNHHTWKSRDSSTVVSTTTAAKVTAVDTPETTETIINSLKNQSNMNDDFMKFHDIYHSSDFTSIKTFSLHTSRRHYNDKRMMSSRSDYFHNNTNNSNSNLNDSEEDNEEDDSPRSNYGNMNNQLLAQSCHTKSGLSVDLSSQALSQLSLLDLLKDELLQDSISLSTIQNVSLAENNLSIDNLPSFTFLSTECPCLRSLDLSKNNLRGSLSLSWLRWNTCQSLKYVDFSQNQLVHIDKIMLLVNLEELNVSHNQLKCIPQLPSTLQRLNLSFNQIDAIVEFRVLGLCKELRELSIHDNPLCNHSNIDIKSTARSLLKNLQILNGETVFKRTSRKEEMNHANSVHSMNHKTISIRKEEQERQDSQRSKPIKVYDKIITIQSSIKHSLHQSSKPSSNLNKLIKLSSLSSSSSSSKYSQLPVDNSPKSLIHVVEDRTCVNPKSIKYTTKPLMSKQTREALETAHEKIKLNTVLSSLRNMKSKFISMIKKPEETQNRNISTSSSSSSSLMKFHTTKESIHVDNRGNNDDLNKELISLWLNQTDHIELGKRCIVIACQIATYDNDDDNLVEKQEKESMSTIDDLRKKFTSHLEKFINSMNRPLPIDVKQTIRMRDYKAIECDMMNQKLKSLSTILHGLKLILLNRSSIDYDHKSIPCRLKSYIEMLMMTKSGKMVDSMILQPAGINYMNILESKIRTELLIYFEGIWISNTLQSENSIHVQKEPERSLGESLNKSSEIKLQRDERLKTIQTNLQQIRKDHDEMINLGPDRDIHMNSVEKSSPTYSLKRRESIPYYPFIESPKRRKSNEELNKDRFFDG